MDVLFLMPGDCWAIVGAAGSSLGATDYTVGAMWAHRPLEYRAFVLQQSCPCFLL